MRKLLLVSVLMLLLFSVSVAASHGRYYGYSSYSEYYPNPAGSLPRSYGGYYASNSYGGWGYQSYGSINYPQYSYYSSYPSSYPDYSSRYSYSYPSYEYSSGYSSDSSAPSYPSYSHTSGLRYSNPTDTLKGGAIYQKQWRGYSQTFFRPDDADTGW